MARRKKQYISDDDLDTSGDSARGDGDDAAPDWDEDPDERAERLKFSDPYGHQRKRKRNGKEEALYGVWAEEEDDASGSARGRASKTIRRSQAFVPSAKATIPSTQDEPGSVIMDIPEAGNAPSLRPSSAGQGDGGDESSGAEDNVSLEEDASDSDDASTSSEDESRKRRVPRVRTEEEEDVPTNADASKTLEAVMSAATAGATATGPARGGIGARSKGGIGSFARGIPLTSTTDSAVPVASTSAAGIGSQEARPGMEAEAQPKASGMAAAKERRAFLGASTPAGQAAPRKTAAPLSKDEQRHFNKLESKGGFGYELLKKMGWSSGSGLGAGGEGMVTPLESKLRPKAMGLAFEGFTERTKQSKQEEKRRKGQAGEAVSEESEDEWGRPKQKKKDKKKQPAGDREQSTGPPAWKQKKPRKPKVQHMSYEDIVAGAQAQTPAGVGAIYDLSGKQLSAAALSHGASAHDVPTTDVRNLPELQHNLSMMLDITKADLDNLVREARIMAERRKWLSREASRVKEASNTKQGRIARLQELTKVVTAIQQHSASLAYDDRSVSAQIASFADLFNKLLDGSTDEEYKRHRLDEVIVAALAPVLKRAWLEWDVLAEPTLFIEDLVHWKKAFRCRQRRSDVASTKAVGLFGNYNTASVLSSNATDINDRQMTPFETLLWTLWMPRVRSSLNNAWDTSNPTPALALYSAWESSGLLPDFISDNILDQLILPKLKRAVSEWIAPRKGKSTGTPLHQVLFPWLEYAGHRMDEVMDDAKRKIRGWLKTAKVRNGAHDGLEVWRDVVPSSEWDNLLLQYVVPQLAVQLREDFVVNPRQQDLAPLTGVLAWRKLLRDSVLSQILETEFFPKYLDALYTWLTSPGVNFEQVAEWYSWWKKEVFGGPLQKLAGVTRGFEAALELMNQAITLGDDAKYRLRKPNFSAAAPGASGKDKHGGSAAASGRNGRALPSAAVSSSAADPNEVTFRSVIEELVAENNLVFMPTGKSHESTGQPLFRISAGVDGKGGVTVYLRGDVAYAQDAAGAWKPIGVSDMMEQAKTK